MGRPDGRMATRGNVLNLPEIVTVQSSVLPTGASTSANQTDGSQVTKIKETVPTDALNNNPSTTLSYDVDGNLQYIDELIGATTYRTTLTY